MGPARTGGPHATRKLLRRDGRLRELVERCRIVGVVNSVQAYRSNAFRRYEPARTGFFDGGIQTGCGRASSAVGPFYCPVDRYVYAAI